MKTIGLVGLYSIDNMGDLVICETSRFLMRKYAEEFDIIDVDAVPRQLSSYPSIRKINLLLAAFLTRYAVPLLLTFVSNTKARYHVERFVWRLRLQWYFKRVIPSCDAIVFSGGGFLKFKNQGLNYLVELVVEICERNNISVMLSGVGIEGYDSDDFRCQRLKSTLESVCIRSVTTRDFIEVLREQYAVGPPTHTALVGDPAFWIPECYGASKQPSKTIGINAIREDIYRAYGNQLSPRDLNSFYINLLTALDRKGVNWVLFTNGMAADHDFGVRLLAAMGKPANLLLTPPQSATDMVTLISGFKAIFGARMHACITAYALDIPVVGLIWNEKLSRLSELTGQRAMFFDEHEMNVDAIVTKLIAAEHPQYDRDTRNELKEKTQSEIDGFLQSLAVS
jgi:polysaccharide pyruvyl transferase WcaK-like protein